MAVVKEKKSRQAIYKDHDEKRKDQLKLNAIRNVPVESIKVDIAFHEKMFFAAIAALMALIGWMTSNYMIVSSLLLLTVLVVSFFLVFTLFINTV